METRIWGLNIGSLSGIFSSAYRDDKELIHHGIEMKMKFFNLCVVEVMVVLSQDSTRRLMTCPHYQKTRRHVIVHPVSDYED